MDHGEVPMAYESNEKSIASAAAAIIWLAPHFCWSVPISRLWVWAAASARARLRARVRARAGWRFGVGE